MQRPRCPCSLEVSDTHEAFRSEPRFGGDSTGIVGFDEVFCQWTRPGKFTDSIFPFNRIGPNHITYSYIAIR